MTNHEVIASSDQYPPTFLPLLDEITKQSASGPGVEGPTAAMFAKLLELQDTPEINSLLVQSAEQMQRREVAVGPTVSGLRTALVGYFRLRYPETFGQEFSDALMRAPADWESPFELLREDIASEANGIGITRESSMAASTLLNAGITFFSAFTPVKERYIMVEALAQITRDRFPEGARVLDIGSSIMAGPLYLMHREQFMPIRFNLVNYQTTYMNEPMPLTLEANALLERPSALKEFVCVDTFPFYDEDRQKFDKAAAAHAISGLRPSERNNSKYLGDLLRAMDIKQIDSDGYKPDSRVTFHQGNLLDPDEFLSFVDTHPEPFDIVVMNYMTQELPHHQQLMLHAVATGLLSDQGLALYNHQAYIPDGVKQPASIEAVRHYSSYASTPWSSNSHIYDSLHPMSGIQEIFNSYDNRNRRLRVRAGELMVNGTLEPVVDLIRHG